MQERKVPSDQPLISVVVPTRNRLSYLGETLRSILAQRYNQLEVLVVADGHDQRVADLVTQLRDPRAKYLSCQLLAGPQYPEISEFNIPGANSSRSATMTTFGILTSCINK